MSEQNFSNHVKFVPSFHFFLIPVLLINIVVHIYTLFKYPMDSPFRIFLAVFSLVLAVALLVLAFLARIFALGVQDRVIRLEECLRYERLLPDDLRTRFGEFSINQLVSLRFASDAELPVLARTVLDGKVNDRKTIKRMVQNWRSDHQRV
jgi:Family of unknown function (DUF6526)